MATIRVFEVSSNGDVKLHENYGRTASDIIRQYYGVPKSVICKLVNAKSAPDVSDFEEWLRTARNKHGKDRTDYVNDYWNSDD